MERPLVRGFSEIVRKQDVDSIALQARAARLERTHDAVIGVVEDWLERCCVDEAVSRLAPFGLRHWHQDASHFGRDESIFAGRV